MFDCYHKEFSVEFGEDSRGDIFQHRKPKMGLSVNIELSRIYWLESIDKFIIDKLAEYDKHNMINTLGCGHCIIPEQMAL